MSPNAAALKQTEDHRRLAKEAKKQLKLQKKTIRKQRKAEALKIKLSRNSKPKKKRKRRAISSSNSSSSDSSSSGDSSASSACLSVSSEEEPAAPGSNWGILASIWPVDQRPPDYQDKETFNNEKLSNLLSLAAMDTANKRAVDGDMSSTVSRDKRPSLVKMRSGYDDCYSKLHPARFQRYPLGKMKRWWKKVPRVHSHMYKNLPLRFSGAQNKLTQKTIQVSHDRSKCMSFKMFHSGNFGVTSKPLKKIEKREEDGVFSTLDFQWESPSTLSQVTEALLNYCSLLQMMWPYDPTGIIMLRLVNKYNHISAAGTLSERISAITAFFNMVCRENSVRAGRKELILSFDEQEECLKEVLQKAGINSAVPSARSPFVALPYQATSAKPRYANGSKPPSATFTSNSSAGSNLGNNNRPRVVLHQGTPICFNYNTGTCKNTQTQTGCIDSNRKQFAHYCNKYLPQRNDHCFMKHPRVSNH